MMSRAVLVVATIVYFPHLLQAGYTDICPEPGWWTNLSVPLRQCVVCPEAPRLKALPKHPKFKETKVTFRNDHHGEVEIHSVDIHGEYYGNLEMMRPGERKSFMAFEGHVFRFVSAETKQVLFEHLVGRRPLESPEAPPPGDGFQDNPIIRWNEVHPSAYFNSGFFNTGGTGLQVFWRHWKGWEEKVSNLAPGNSHLEHTYQDHKWVVRMSDGSVKKSFMISDILIVDCPKPGRPEDYDEVVTFEPPIPKPEEEDVMASGEQIIVAAPAKETANQTCTTDGRNGSKIMSH